MYGKLKTILTLFIVISFCSVPAFAAVSMSDEAVLGNQRWSVQNDGDLAPGADSSYDIGESGNEVSNIYVDSVTTTSVTATGLANLNGGIAVDTNKFTVADGTGDTVVAGTLAVTGAVSATGAVTLGDAVTDVTTLTGKIAGATPISFDGATANAVYTILAVADPVSSSKTVTLPSITSTISLETAATSVLTADTTATITVVPGTDVLYTYTIDTDDENCTLTFSAGGTIGDRATIIFITDPAGSLDEIMTFDGTLSDSAGTLTLATGASKRYVIEFVSDGTIWNEVSRTAVLG